MAAIIDSKVQVRLRAAVDELNADGKAAVPVAYETGDGNVVYLVATRAEKREALEKKNGGLLFKTLDEVLANRSSVRWLIPDWLERGVIALIAGPRATFKSFLLLDRLMRVALTGEPVAIISAEGRGIDRRIRAWLKTFAPGVDQSDLRMQVIERRLDLWEGDDLVRVRAELELTKPVVVGLDTWSKLCGRLQENSNDDCRQFIARMDSELKTPLDTTVVIVTHSGHSETGRARGASAIGADTDAEFTIRKQSDSSIIVTRERFKDSPSLDPVRFETEIISLGYVDDEGKPVTSLILRETDKPTYEKRKRPPGQQGEVLKVAEKHAHAEPISVQKLVELVIEATPQGNSTKAQRRSNLTRTIRKLVETQWLFMHPGDCVSLSTARPVDDSWIDDE